MFGEGYVRLILGLAPFVVCLAFSLKSRVSKVWLGSAALFALTAIWEPVPFVGILPWLSLITWKAIQELRVFQGDATFETSRLAELASYLYLPVGGIWALFDQLNFQPLGFSSIIVLLTGVHFHYAGFALPHLTALWLQDSEPGQASKVFSWGIILGVPLVAIGITTSQLSMPFWIETLAVSILAASAFWVSLAQFTWALKSPYALGPKLLFSLGGLALAAGMVLATIYGWRHVFVASWATIPLMYALHGTLNSLGFCLPGFLAWKWVEALRTTDRSCDHPKNPEVEKMS